MLVHNPPNYINKKIENIFLNTKMHSNSSDSFNIFFVILMGNDDCDIHVG